MALAQFFTVSSAKHPVLQLALIAAEFCAYFSFNTSLNTLTSERVGNDSCGHGYVSDFRAVLLAIDGILSTQRMPSRRKLYEGLLADTA